MFKKFSIVLLVLLTVLCFTLGVGATAAGLFVKKDAGNTYIDYVNADGTSIMKIDDTDGVTIASYVAGNTYTTMTLTSTLDASSLTAGSFVTPGGAAIAKQLYLGDDLDMSVSTTSGTYDITLLTNKADALSICDTAPGDLIVFTTTTGSQGITITPATTITGLFTSIGGITVGISGTGADVTFYGNTATCDFVWDQDGDTNGSLTLGSSGGSAGVDFTAYGHTNGNYLMWDRSADDLLLVGTSTQLGVAGTTTSTTPTTGSIHTAGGLGVAENVNIGGTLTVSVDGGGTDVTIYGNTASYYVLFDADADTNGAWYFGADTKGLMVALYGDTTGCGIFWNPSTDTNGTLSIGATGGAKGVDVVMYGHTSGSYLMWDRSADALLIVASTITFSGAITTGITMPGDVDYTPIKIGTKASSATGGFNVASTTADDSGGVQIYGDDAGASLTYPVEVLTPLRVRYLLSVDQTGGVSHTALFAQMVSNGTRSYTTGCVRAVYAFLQLGAVTLVTSGEVVGINQATTLVGNMVVGTGCTFAGIDINIATGVYTIDSGGTNAALLIRSSGTGLWRNGLEIATSGATTGIKIGTCVTGISMTGAYSTAAVTISTTLAAVDDHGISSTVTCAATSGEMTGNEFVATMTGAGMTGFATKTVMNVTNVEAGAYVNAISGVLDFKASGKVVGLASAVCAELIMSQGELGTGGTYAVLELEMGLPHDLAQAGGVLTANGLSVIYVGAYGDHVTMFDDYGCLFNINGVTAGANDFFYLADLTVTKADGLLKIRVNGTTYYMFITTAINGG